VNHRAEDRLCPSREFLFQRVYTHTLEPIISNVSAARDASAANVAFAPPLVSVQFREGSSEKSGPPSPGVTELAQFKETVR
jgi:hypothetical protein